MALQDLMRNRHVRSWLGLFFLVAAYCAFGPVESAVHRPIAVAFRLHMIVAGELGLLPYAALMLVRLMLDLVVVAGVMAILGHRFSGFPLVGPRIVGLTINGLATGLLVMASAILAIIMSGNGVITISSQSLFLAVMHGAGWLAFDYVGAAGEELFGRVAALLVAQRFVGWRGATIISGLMFSVLHLDNPGASWIWLARLFLQGMLLAYAVYRTRSVWWSIGYHVGWNWASAPLFGAAGSGFLDQGHLFDFTPGGSIWITGGTVGPEGSVFAFAAVLCALILLVMTTSNRQALERRV